MSVGCYQACGVSQQQHNSSLNIVACRPKGVGRLFEAEAHRLELGDLGGGSRGMGGAEWVVHGSGANDRKEEHGLGTRGEREEFAL